MSLKRIPSGCFASSFLATKLFFRGWLAFRVERRTLFSLFSHPSFLPGLGPLMLGAMGGHADVVKTLLDWRADPSASQETDAFSVLMWAAQEGYWPVVKTLLKQGADVDARRTDNGCTALLLGAHNGHLQVVKVTRFFCFHGHIFC
jgi:ankyrin repeat protein